MKQQQQLPAAAQEFQSQQLRRSCQLLKGSGDKSHVLSSETPAWTKAPLSRSGTDLLYPYTAAAGIIPLTPPATSPTALAVSLYVPPPPAAAAALPPAAAGDDSSCLGTSSNWVEPILTFGVLVTWQALFHTPLPSFAQEGPTKSRLTFGPLTCFQLVSDLLFYI